MIFVSLWYYASLIYPVNTQDLDIVGHTYTCKGDKGVESGVNEICHIQVQLKGPHVNFEQIKDILCRELTNRVFGDPYSLCCENLKVIMDRLYILVIILHLSILAKKSFYCNDNIITGLGFSDCKTPSTAYVILCELNGIYEFWTRTGGWESDRSHDTGTSSPSHLQQFEEPVGWIMCFVLMTIVPVQKLCVDICICIPHMSSVIGHIYTHTTGLRFGIGEAAPHHIL